MSAVADVETINRRRMNVLLGAAVLIASIPILITYFILIASSFTNQMITGMVIGQLTFTLRNWILFFQGKLTVSAASLYSTWTILRYIFNTFIVAFGVMAVVTTVTALAGYACSRMRFRGRHFLIQLLILLHAFPGVSLIIAVYAIYIFTKNPLPYNAWTLYAFLYVIVARAALEIPMDIWIMKGFFDKVPWEVEWSALVDGASRIKVWKDIILPLVKPGVATVAIFSFIAGWGALIYVYVFLPPIQKTLATYIEGLLSGGSMEFVSLPVVAAAGTLYLLPTLFFFAYVRRYMLQTSLSGIKG